jgi:hypothetical protein
LDIYIFIYTRHVQMKTGLVTPRMLECTDIDDILH